MLTIVSTAAAKKLSDFLSVPLFQSGIAAQVISTDSPIPENTTTLLLMGSGPFNYLVEGGVVGKKQKMGSAREKVFQYLGYPTLVTYDVGILAISPERRPEMTWDLNLAIRLEKTGGLNPQLGKYEWVSDYSQLVSKIEACAEGEYVDVSCDLETIGLDEFAPEARILTISFTHEVGSSQVYLVPATGIDPAVKEQIRTILTHPRVKMLGANFKYDSRWIYKHWNIVCTNQKFDTQLVGGLLDENRINSLNLHTKIYSPELGGYDDEFNRKYDKSRMDLVPLPDLLDYAGGDTDAVLRIYGPLKKDLLKDPQQTRFYTRLLHPASLVFRKLESRGVQVNAKRYEELEVEAKEEIAQLHKECFEMIPRKIRLKYDDNLSLTRDVILKDYLFTTQGLNLKPTVFTAKENKPSTAWNHLKLFADHPDAGPFIKKLKAFKAVSKTLSTYITGFKHHVRSDGMFHPSYIMVRSSYGDDDDDAGTNTGRMSCKDPAYQTIPKRTSWAKRLRSVYDCPPGKVIVKLDFSQGELRIMADQADVRAMLQAYKDGLDLHAITACSINNITLEYLYSLSDDVIEKLRSGAKAGNFGLIYRISVEGFVQFAANSYGVYLTLDEAADFVDKFFAKYPEVHDYHESQVAFAQKHLYVRNPMGRVRHLTMINSSDSMIRGQQERQSINAPIQGCLSDMMLLLMVLIDRERPDIWMFGNTHDSLEMYLDVDTWQYDVKLIKGIAENLPLSDFGWTPKVNFVVDFEYSDVNLAQVKKYKVA